MIFTLSKLVAPYVEQAHFRNHLWLILAIRECRGDQNFSGNHLPNKFKIFSTLFIGQVVTNITYGFLANSQLWRIFPSI